MASLRTELQARRIRLDRAIRSIEDRNDLELLRRIAVDRGACCDGGCCGWWNSSRCRGREGRSLRRGRSCHRCVVFARSGARRCCGGNVRHCFRRRGATGGLGRLRRRRWSGFNCFGLDLRRWRRRSARGFRLFRRRRSTRADSTLSDIGWHIRTGTSGFLMLECRAGARRRLFLFVGVRLRVGVLASRNVALLLRFRKWRRFRRCGRIGLRQRRRLRAFLGLRRRLGALFADFRSFATCSEQSARRKYHQSKSRPACRPAPAFSSPNHATLP